MRVRPSEITLLLAISLFFGLAVEEFAAQDIPNRPGAVPTFPLLALAGAALLLAGRREMHRSAAACRSKRFSPPESSCCWSGSSWHCSPNPPIAYLSEITALKILLRVIAVSALSYGSRLLQRCVHPKDATLLAAALGGLYSSTANTGHLVAAEP